MSIVAGKRLNTGLSGTVVAFLLEEGLSFPIGPRTIIRRYEIHEQDNWH
jgi:hypothetical protein